jgi:hypothetical protein
MRRFHAALAIPAIVAVTLGLAAGVRAAPQADARPDAAPVRKRVCHPCSIPAFGVAAPRHGVLLARSGTYGAGTEYLLFDLDRRLLARGTVARGAAGRAPLTAVTATITPDEAASLLDIVNRIWAEPGALPGTGASDVFWEAWLADGGLLRRERGPGNPPGLAETLENRMLAILSDHATGR